MVRRMRNIGIIDCLLRFVGLHLAISLIDIDVFNSAILATLISIAGFYFLLTAIIRIDPVYLLAKINTLEPVVDAK